MAKLKGTIIVNTERCKGCNLCVVACPQDVLLLNKEANAKGYNYSYMKTPEDCTGCVACALVCPDACITVYRVKVEEKVNV
ncbi:MAG: ferredoxin family protein [Paludibacteraceae bacterium]